jgi:hypothetical protein
MSLDQRILDHKVLPTNMFMSPAMMVKERVGIGDDLFFPGLFTPRPGRKANLPIVRIGNISAMPDEPIETIEHGVLPRAYLIEARSIGGLSGSPVFWFSGVNRMTESGTSIGSWTFYLIGLVHGHYNAKGNIWDFGGETTPDGSGKPPENAGIAIMIPASDILDTLNHPNLQKQREILRQGILAERQINLPVPDVVADVPSEAFFQEDAIAGIDSDSNASGHFSADTTELPPTDQ